MAAARAVRTRGAQLLYCASCRCWLCFDVSCTRCTQELAASVSKIHLRFTSSSLLRELLPPSSHRVRGSRPGSRRRPAGGTCTVIVVSHRAASVTADRRVRVDGLSLSVEPPRTPIPPPLTRAAIVPAAHPSTQRRLCLLRCKGEGRPELASRATVPQRRLVACPLVPPPCMLLGRATMQWRAATPQQLH